MTTSRSSALPLFLALAFAGCTGEHTLGTSLDELNSKCCVVSATGEQVGACPANEKCACDPQLCQKGGQCQTIADCPQLEVPCQICTDGSSACPVIDCIKGQCQATLNHCPAPSCNVDTDCVVATASGMNGTDPGMATDPANGTQPFACVPCADGSCAPLVAKCVQKMCVVEKPTCPPPPAPGCDPSSAKPGTECTPSADVCQICPDGTKTCAIGKCDTGGQCIVLFPSCPPPSTQCDPTKICPQPAAPCKQCADGTLACPKAWCENGVCAASFPTCPSVTPPVQCKLDTDCPSAGTQVCKICPNGTKACPTPKCTADGQCTTVYPTICM